MEGIKNLSRQVIAHKLKESQLGFKQKFKFVLISNGSQDGQSTEQDGKKL